MKFMQCLYASFKRKLTPTNFSPYILVKLKRYGFAKWVKILLQISCKSLLSLTSYDCWGNAIWHVFQAAFLDDVYVDQRLAIVRYSSS